MLTPLFTTATEAPSDADTANPRGWNGRAAPGTLAAVVGVSLLAAHVPPQVVAPHVDQVVRVSIIALRHADKLSPGPTPLSRVVTGAGGGVGVGGTAAASAPPSPTAASVAAAAAVPKLQTGALTAVLALNGATEGAEGGSGVPGLAMDGLWIK